MLVDVQRVHVWLYEQFELVVGAVVADDDRDRVRVGCPEKQHENACVPSACEHYSRRLAFGHGHDSSGSASPVEARRLCRATSELGAVGRQDVGVLPTS